MVESFTLNITNGHGSRDSLFFYFRLSYHYKFKHGLSLWNKSEKEQTGKNRYLLPTRFDNKLSDLFYNNNAFALHFEALHLPIHSHRRLNVSNNRLIPVPTTTINLLFRILRHNTNIPSKPGPYFSPIVNPNRIGFHAYVFDQYDRCGLV